MRRPQRWRMAAAGCALAVTAATLGSASASTPSSTPFPPTGPTLATAAPASVCAADWNDPIHRRMRVLVTNWISWLERYHVPGIVGEFGWPDNTRGDGAHWNCVGQDFFSLLDAHNISALGWRVSEYGPARLSTLDIYLSPAPRTPPVIRQFQAPVIEAHPARAAGELRGVAFVDGQMPYGSAYGTSVESNTVTGVPDVDHGYGLPLTYQFLASRGINSVRIALRWERLQPKLYGPLDAVELGLLKQSVAAAQKAGLTVVLDLHNFGQYYAQTLGSAKPAQWALGSPQLPLTALIDFWLKMSQAFHHPGVGDGVVPSKLVYLIMNEPVRMPSIGRYAPQDVWHIVSNAVVQQLRAHHDNTWVIADGYYWDNVVAFTQYNPVPWINDPAHHVVYDAHVYFDTGLSSRYTDSYAQERAKLGG